ncbi:MAG: alpha/beta fold hydrolase [Gaiellaceae bacterium]
MNVTTVAAGGVDLVVREWGEASERAVIFWHGLSPFGALQLNEAGPAWAARGFRVIAPAVPGISSPGALADPGQYRPTRLARIELELAAALGLRRFAHVGSSWGAFVGVHAAAAAPAAVSALVLLDAGHLDDSTPRATLAERVAEYEAMQAGFSFSSWEAFLEAARPQSRAHEERLCARMCERDGSIVPRSDHHAAAAAFTGLQEEPPSPKFPLLARTGVPVLLVLAGHNPDTADTTRFRAEVTQAEVRTLDGGHDLLAECAPATIELVAEWLAERARWPSGETAVPCLP